MKGDTMRSKFSWLYYVLIFSLIASLSLFNCSKEESTEPEPQKSEFQLVAEKGDQFFTGGIKLISAADLYAALNGPDAGNYFLLDVRSQADYESGHISGAIRMNAADVLDNLSQIPKDKKVIIICYTGQTASQLNTVLNMLGYESYALKFGMCGWTTDPSVNGSTKWLNLQPTGAQLETTPHKLTTKFDYPKINTGKSKVEDIIIAQADNYFDAGTKNVAAASVWPNLSDYFIITSCKKEHYNNGHIPGAHRVAMDSLGYDEYLKFLPPPPQKILVYCYTGHESSHLTAYLNTLGYDAYNFLFGINAVTDDLSICKTHYTPPAQNYPVVTGPNP